VIRALVAKEKEGCHLFTARSISRFLKRYLSESLPMSRLLAFVDIFVESPHMDEVVRELAQLPNMEELYEVTGEFDIVSLVSATDIEEFRDVLKNRIMKIKGVKSTVSSIVLHSHKGPRCNGGNGKLQASPATAVPFTAGISR
jgi:DNA-binding Lrp family transcriptional regulator